MKIILFRCDSSNIIGSGHVSRCRNLARGLKNQGARIIFVCRDHNLNLIEKLKKEFKVLVITDDLLNTCFDFKNTFSKRNLFQLKDSEATFKLILKEDLLNIKWVIVDHYELGKEWEISIKENLKNHKKLKLMAIDDLRSRNHEVDILLDQNYYNFNDISILNWQGKRKNLIGCNYCLLSEEYALLHNRIPNRQILSRILIFFGGADPHNILCGVIDILKKDSFKKFNFDIVIGGQAEYFERVKTMVADNPNFKIHINLPSLSNLMIRSDAAIGAAGSSAWERACLNLPSIVFTFGFDQEVASKSFHEDGYNILIGDKNKVNFQNIFNSIEKLSNSIGSIKTGYNLVDGKGVGRVSLAIMGPKLPILLKDAKEHDLDLFWRWANDILERNNSNKISFIDYQDYKKYFLECLKDKNITKMIALDSNQRELGQVSFDLNDINNHAMIDLYIDSAARSFGISSKVIELGLKKMEKKLGRKIITKAKVLKSNIKGINCFTNAGFEIENDSLDIDKNFIRLRFF